MIGFIPKISEIKKDIYLFFKKELEKKRRSEQVEQLLEKAKQKDHLVEKLAKELLKRKLYFQIENYINAQFVALNYLKYLPKIEIIASLNGFKRWEKYKDFYKYIEQKINYKKVEKRRSKRKINFSDKELLNLKKVLKYEEDDKRLFFNKPQGFDLCLSNDIFFNLKSNLCNKCDYKVYCKNILKKKCFPLFQFRSDIIGEKTFLNKIKRIQFSQ